MKLVLFTLALDAMPFIVWHLPVLNRLKIPWQWIIVHGASDNIRDTGWCRKQEARLSMDGTTEYLQMISGHPRVTVLERELWPGKTAMCNAAVEQIRDSCVLMQVDADELWLPEQLETIADLFYCQQHFDVMQFYCRYFIGQDIIATGEDCYGNGSTEWIRAWRFAPGMKFETHEPPVLAGCGARLLTRSETKDIGLIFDHYAYATRNQIEYKAGFYGYGRAAVDGWLRLQSNRKWPAKLKEYFHWVDDKVMAVKI